MRQRHLLVPTLREVPADAEIASHRLMLRAGLMRQVAAGIYTYLPLGWRVIQKVMTIIREEMNRAGAQELLLPSLHPAELWQESGRWEYYGPELMRLKDRHNRDFALGPTHEEVVTALLRDEVKSYKKLPITVYQIQTKFRDERRPRFGVMRGREFIMKDAYSFDVDEAGLDKSYQAMYEAYMRIFTRCGLKFRAVEADAGAIGGTSTHEFMVLSDVGEDTLAYCTNCSYAANLEKAEVAAPRVDKPSGGVAERQRVATPGVRTVAELVAHLGVTAEQIIKSVLFLVDGRPVLVLVRGDHEVNEVKVKNLFGANTVEMADDETVRRVMGAPAGFIGPVNAPETVPVVADRAVEGVADGVVGANEADAHFVHVVPGRDFAVSRYADLRNIAEGDPCPRCGGTIAFAKGIEVGHVFKLGTKYSEAMGATFLDEEGRERPMIMGCYGIGVTRVVAAIIEQHHDENGIIWPVSVAPFAVHVVPVNWKDEAQRAAAERLYAAFNAAGIEALLDDRDERAGVKFKDADLIGLPLRVTVGGKVADGLVELKVRATGEQEDVPLDEVVERVRRRLDELEAPTRV
ncbi:proline--tRNA ligase [Calditerricola yamamurae]|jgi:prolyl-tRNA synthetase, family II